MLGPAVDVVVHADVSVPYLDADVRAAVDEIRDNDAALDVFRGGSWFATASIRDEIVGCARAVRADRSAPVPMASPLYALGVDRFDEWLAGGLELTELAVAPGHRGRGVGSALQRAVVTPARNRRGWAQLSGSGTLASERWLRRRGWVVVARDRDTDGTVLLDARHPASPLLTRRPAPGTAAARRRRN